MTSEHVVLALSIIHSLDFITTRHLYFRVSLSIVCYVLLYVRTRRVSRYQKGNHTGTVNRKKENLMTKRKQTIGQIMINTIFSYIVAVSVVLVEKPEYPETTTDLQQINDKLYHIMLYRVHLMRSSGQKQQMSSNILKNVFLLQLLLFDFVIQ